VNSVPNDEWTLISSLPLEENKLTDLRSQHKPNQGTEAGKINNFILLIFAVLKIITMSQAWKDIMYPNLRAGINDN
jgi:hypothetical protein